MNLKLTKIALITNIYAPYRAPTWAAVAHNVGELHVILLSANEENRLWNQETESKLYKTHILDSKGKFNVKYETGLYWGGGIRKLLKTIKPDFIVSAGYSLPPFIEAIFWAKYNKVPLVQWYESHNKSSRHTKWPLSSIRSLLLKQANGWSAASSLTEKYLMSMGIPQERIIVTPNSIDIATIEKHVKIRQTNSRTQKAKFLFVGRFVSLKRIDLLIRAFKKLETSSAELRLVGYGPDESKLRTLARNTQNIFFCDATVSLEETCKHYEWADILVLPSLREVWGLVINEALAAGCYVLASSLAGATTDLIEKAPIDVGIPFDPNDGENALKLLFEKTIQDIQQIRDRRTQISEWGNEFSPTRTANALLSAIALAKKQL